ncbi:hypothetical protein GGR42_002194 [Saonia flava]|uniref:Lipoprotein n=1 Tax=Saonia flava TaxID=523696 RepID=A0A846QYL4_9FLAO|nr:hypothetical protein [Saonia flava]NJB71732.1 hypothetical protein [Saonia flava]
MEKLFCLGMIFLLFVSCDGNKKDEVTNVDTAQEFSLGKLKKPIATNPKAKEILNKWPEFNALETSFNALYNVNSQEDLTLVIEDLIEKQKLLAASNYPLQFNVAQIKSRQNVFKSFVLKTKGDLEYRIAPQESVKEMVTAYNALRNQFNVITNNPLDIKSLLE